MNIGMIKDEVIKLIRSSWDLSGRFSRRQYITVSVILFLLKMSYAFILLSVGVISDEFEFTGILRSILLLVLIGSIILNWSLALTLIGATVRRFHDMDMSGWYIVVLGITGVISYWLEWTEKYPVSREQFDINIPGWDILAFVVLLLGLVLWLYLFFRKGKEMGKTRWG